MIASEQLLVFSMACAAFAAAVLLRKSRVAITRALILVCLGVFVTVQFGVMRLCGASTPEEAVAAARMLYLTHALGAVPWALLAVVSGGAERLWRFRGRTLFVAAAAVGGATLATLTNSELVLAEITRDEGHVRVTLGVAGKLLLVYVTAVAAFMLTQVETLLRAALRVQDRIPRVVVAMVGLSVIVYVYVAAEAFLYGRLQADTLATASVPTSVTCVAAGAARLRRSIDDMRFPVARGVVYSSFTLFILGLLMIVLGLLSRVAELVGVSLNQTFLIATSALAAVLGVSLWASPTWKRRVAEFIDENFYVNRHDYRREWTRMARNVRLSDDRDELVRAAGAAITEIFHGRPVHVAVSDPANDRFTVYDAQGQLLEALAPPLQGALAGVLTLRGEAIAFDDVRSDLELVPAYVENEVGLDAIEASVLAPMLSGDRLVGFLAFSSGRDGSAYTPEDLSLMTMLAAELANTLYGHLLLREVQERREGEALVKLSSFVIHDLKNGLSSLQGILEGAERHLDEPEFRTDLVDSLSSTSRRMSHLIERLGELRADPTAPRRRNVSCQIADLVNAALLHCSARTADGIALTVDVSRGLRTMGDPEMLEQVFVNIVRNAIESMHEGGALTIKAVEDDGVTRVSIADRGCGMEPRFVAESLFRPFASTKKQGLGIGLYQCKNIVEEHGGRINVWTKPGEGTRVELSLPPAMEAESECETVS